MNNYLDVLPTEIKLKICCHLQPVDLILLGDAYSSFQNIITCTKLSKVSIRDYRFNVKHLGNFLCKKPISEYITNLNISYVYWIRRDELKKAIVQLPNLESLFAEGTKLDLNTILSATLETLNNIHTISASYNHSADFTFDLPEALRITHLYIYYVDGGDALFRGLSVYLLLGFDNLEQLVVLNMTKPFGRCYARSCAHESEGAGYRALMLTVKNIKLVFVNDTKVRAAPGHGFYEIQNCFEMGVLHVNTRSDDFHNYCDRFINNLPFSGKCCHNKPDPISDGNELITCYCSWELDKTNVNRKRRHSATPIDVALTTPNYTHENIQLNMSCAKVGCRHSISGSLTNLCKWVFLKKLELRNIPYPDGQPLPQVFQSCRLLESVNFEWDKPNDAFTDYLCEGLKWAENLKHFRYSIKHTISLISLLESLTTCPKLEKVFIESISKLTYTQLLSQALLALMQKPDVIFLGVVMDILHKHANQIRKEVRKVIRSNKRKVFLFEPRFKSSLKSYIYKTVPFEHVKDMIFTNPTICLGRDNETFDI